MTKEILEQYLNNVYFGRNAWGIAEAAKVYFSLNEVFSLIVSQAAFGAGLPQVPSYFSANINSAKNRQKLVIQKMKDLGYLPYDFQDIMPEVKPWSKPNKT